MVWRLGTKAPKQGPWCLRAAALGHRTERRTWTCGLAWRGPISHHASPGYQTLIRLWGFFLSFVSLFFGLSLSICLSVCPSVSHYFPFPPTFPSSRFLPTFSSSLPPSSFPPFHPPLFFPPSPLAPSPSFPSLPVTIYPGALKQSEMAPPMERILPDAAFPQLVTGVMSARQAL